MWITGELKAWFEGYRGRYLLWEDVKISEQQMPQQETKIAGGESVSKEIRRLEISFGKSPAFRSIHATGAWFGSDPDGNMHLTFFREQTTLPEKVIIQLDSNGAVISQDEIKIDKSTFVRTAEVDISFTISSALAFYKLLGENLKHINALWH